MNKLQNLTPANGTTKTATILSVENRKHWSPNVTQKVTQVLLNETYGVTFSSVNSNGLDPYLDETCVFFLDDSEIIGSSDFDVQQFLESEGYEVTTALDNTTPKELG